MKLASSEKEPVPTVSQQRIGDVIRRRRKAKNCSQESFADEIEMHRAQYGLLERGRTDPRLSSLERVAKGLKVPLWVILRDAEAQ